MRFYPLEKLINLHDAYSRQFRIDSNNLLLIQRLGMLYLIEATCPHREYPLDLGSIEGSVIQCARHQYRFSMKDGSLIQATDETCRNLRTFDIVYEGNEVGLMLEDQ